MSAKYPLRVELLLGPEVRSTQTKEVDLWRFGKKLQDMLDQIVPGCRYVTVEVDQPFLISPARFWMHEETLRKDVAVGFCVDMAKPLGLYTIDLNSATKAVFVFEHDVPPLSSPVGEVRFQRDPLV